jgi:superfamily II DNA or RNA helicase
MDKKRQFSRRQKNALFVAAFGKCEMCGNDLPPGWHADHIVPYIKNGNTSLINGRALCPLCNLKKGSSMSFKDLRPFQREFIDAVLNKAQQVGSTPKRFIANVTPGSGKTLASLAAADALLEAGFIDTVIHLSPRLNLAHQMEDDSKDFIQSPLRKVLNRVEHRLNEPPLVRPPASGYATTYASVMSNVVLHLQTVRGKKYLLICDELQQLGVDYDGENSTKSADAVKELAQNAFMVIGMTGTPYRADDSRLLFADYSDPDENGMIQLQADVQATYRMGVVEGYLRKFEFHLYDGGTDWNNLGVVERLEISEMDKGLWRVLQEPEFWKPLVDQFVEIANEQRRITHTGLKDLIAARNQKQAGEIQEYLNKRHHIKALKAVSDDGAEAHEALRQFKYGKHTTLVTVNMAYVGYDCPAIAHILPLTAYRAGGYLSQLTARGLRVWRDIPAENQTCYMIAPNDPSMARFVEVLRNESALGLMDRQRRAAEQDKERAEQMNLGYAESTYLGDMIAKGYHPEGDAVGQEFTYIEAIRREMNIATPATQLNAFMKAVNAAPQANQPTTPANPMPLTEREKEMKARAELSKLVNSYSYAADMEPNEVWFALTRTDGKKNPQRSLSELHRCIEIVQTWIEKERHD